MLCSLAPDAPSWPVIPPRGNRAHHSHLIGPPRSRSLRSGRASPGPTAPRRPRFSLRTRSRRRVKTVREQCAYEVTRATRVCPLGVADSHDSTQQQVARASGIAYIAVRTPRCRPFLMPPNFHAHARSTKGRSHRSACACQPGDGRGPQSGQHERVSRTPLGQRHAAVTIHTLHTVATAHTTGSSHERVLCAGSRWEHPRRRRARAW